MKKIFAVLISLVLSYFAAFPVGKWFASKYAVGGFMYVGSFPGFLDGFLFSYVLFSSLFVSIISHKIKYGFAAALPVLIFDILHPTDPQFFYSLVFLASGLALAWVILKIKQT